MQFRAHDSLRKSREYKKRAASAIANAAATNVSCEGLEREIHAGADHTKIIIWAVHEIPAEITDPANVRG